jgi:hypothetical protein
VGANVDVSDVLPAAEGAWRRERAGATEVGVEDLGAVEGEGYALADARVQREGRWAGWRRWWCWWRALWTQGFGGASE